MHVLRGFDGCEPSNYTKEAAIHPDNAATGVNPIVSGDVVSIQGGVWVRGLVDGVIPYLALSDAKSTDVIGTGKLPALSCAGKFEIETARYNTALTYVEDTDEVRGHLNGQAGEGTVTNAVAGATIGNDIIGYVSKGVVDLNLARNVDIITPEPGLEPTDYTNFVGTPKTFGYPFQTNELVPGGSVSVLTFITNYVRV
jgi:hypothetical protein